MALDAVLALGKGIKGKASSTQLKAADSILDRAGIPRSSEVKAGVDLGRELLAILDRNPTPREEE